MLTSRVLLTYKRKRFRARSDHCGIDASPSKLLKLAGPTDLNEEINNDAQNSGVDFLFSKKIDSTRYDCSYTTAIVDESVDLKGNLEPQLPDLNVAEVLASSETDLGPDAMCHIAFPEDPIGTQLVSGKGICHLSEPKASSEGFHDLSSKVNVSNKSDMSPKLNANKVGLETLRQGISDAPLITFTRRAKMKKCVARECTKYASVQTGSIVCNPGNSVDSSNENVMFSMRKQISFHRSEENLMVNIEEENNVQHLGDLPHTKLTAVDNNLENSVPSAENHNIDLQFSEHSELVECDKEEHPLKLNLCSSSLLNCSEHDEINRGKQLDVGKSVENNLVLGSVLNVNSSYMKAVPADALHNHHPSTTIAVTDSRIGDFRWSKVPWETLQLLQRESKACQSAKEGFVGNSQNQRRWNYDTSHVKLDWHNPHELNQRRNPHSTQFQDSMLLPNSTEVKCEPSYFHPERSTNFTNFLGPSSSHVDPVSSSITNMGSMPKPLGLYNRDTPCYSSQFLLGNLPLGKPQAVDNILMGVRALSQRQGPSLAVGKQQNNWSDEELDSLWIGVRRHGRSNWNAILRDPRLYILSGRNQKELAERWEIEQSRLFRGSLLNWNKPGDGIVENLASECAPSKTETHLSLGTEQHPWKPENYVNSKLFQLPDARNVNSFVSPAPHVMDEYPKNSFWRKPNAKTPKQSWVLRPSLLAGKPTALPHWLKEVVTAPPHRLSEPSIQSASDSCRGILKRSALCSGLSSTELVLGNGVSAINKNKFDLNSNSDQGIDNGVVIVTSDASSEETISDHDRA